MQFTGETKVFVVSGVETSGTMNLGSTSHYLKNECQVDHRPIFEK